MTQLHKETIEKLEATIKEAQFQIEELKKPVSNRWKPKKGEFYYFIEDYNVNENIQSRCWVCSLGDDIRLKNGNCFKTEVDAAKSLKHYIMNSEYDYWIPGVTPCKPSFQPKNLMRFKPSTKEWERGDIPVENWSVCMYRWKRSEQ